MHETCGYAKNVFLQSIKGGVINPQRDITQMTDPSNWKPEVNDLEMLDEHADNT